MALAEYDSIELGPFGYLPTDARQLAGELERRSLSLAGGTLSGDFDAPDGWPEMRARTASVCDLLQHFGAQYVVILDRGFTDGPFELDATGWACIRDNLHRLGEYTANRGIQAVFHPHADTTIQYEPEIERLLELTDSNLVSLCLDVGHHAYAGGEPVSFYRKHHARIPYLHLKDVDPLVTQRARTAGLTMSRAVADGAFVDLGRGCVDFVGLKHATDEVGYDGWGIVEQDMYPAPFDKPLPIARHNRAFLRACGIG